MVHFLRYISGNKTFCLKYYSDMKDAHLSDLLRQASINTDNNLMIFSDYICKDCPDTGRITGSYIIIYQGGTIGHVTHVPGQFSQSSV